jgi:phosphinothricin acetyltransferase
VDECSIRTAYPVQDAQACAALYGHYVQHSTATFEYDPPTVHLMASRMESSLATHEWLVAERGGDISGLAYATAWNPRPAYDWTCETTVYVRAGAEGSGIGTALYRHLLTRLRARGFHLAIGRIALPNLASVRLHERLGYEPVGIHRNLGFKHGQWIDVMHTALQLNPATGEPAPIQTR